KKKKLRNGLIDAIGNTPLIPINSLSKATGCEILEKCEILNPGGRVKDGVAVKIIEKDREPCYSCSCLRMQMPCGYP
ncbi:hypothetical protein CMV_027291, partial [Castanea mollissima]